MKNSKKSFSELKDQWKRKRAFYQSHREFSKRARQMVMSQDNSGKGLRCIKFRRSISSQRDIEEIERAIEEN